ncbi:hypothetical protein T492DRAFT_874676 [Pavlovales sp. CCMP2436]|nr:hypothetical protein T492DRAFT_874676 [Pavlovales sp. CCMP2436]
MSSDEERGEVDELPARYTVDGVLNFEVVSHVIDRLRADSAAGGGAAADDDSEGGDATGLLSDDDNDDSTHAERGTWNVETIVKFRFNKKRRRDEWFVK